MDGLGNSMDGILVLGATNLPWMLDVGIRRRFEQRIYIPLPDREARLKMFGGVQRYADLTEGYSGADISIVINKAKMQPIRITQTATHFKYIKEISPVTNVEENDMLIPCSPGDPDAVPMIWMEIKPGKLLIPKVRKGDYIKSIQEVKPSVNQKDLVRYEEWTRDFGSE
jgi:vacuolar protein-sorting-associated protein 4